MGKINLTENRDGFLLGIADFTLHVECNHYNLSEMLGLRYIDFPPGEKVTFSAQIEFIGEERISSLLDTNTNFHDGILHFSAPGYQGFIDEKSRQGFLRLSSTQPVEDIDYFLRVSLALLAHQAGGILLHTAGIIRDGRAYLFFGHSGSGKTTVCKVSVQDKSSTEFIVLNDDLILLCPQEKGWSAHGTPFWNPTQIRPTNRSAPVAGLYLLVQDNRVYTRELTSGQATAALMSNVPVIPQDSARSLHLLDKLSHLQKSIFVRELHFLPDNSFWDVVQG